MRDYVCRGDIEELQSVVREAFGAAYVVNDGTPRYDLLEGRRERLGITRTPGPPATTTTRGFKVRA